MVKAKKGQIADLQRLVVPLVGVAIVLAIGFLIMAEVKSQAVETERSTADYALCNGTNVNGSCGFAVNGTTTTIAAMSDIPGWLPIIVITVIGAILIGLVGVFRTS